MYIQKRTYSYYFRLQIPRSLRPSYGKAEICFSLNTLDRTEARLKALEYTHQYLLEFEQKKALPISQTVNPTSTQANVSVIGASYSFTDVYEKYLHERKPAEKSVVELDCVVHRFVAVCSDKDIRMYAKADIVRFKDFLVDCPKYLTQDDLKQPIDLIMKKYRGTHYEKLSAKTIKSKYIGLLHAIFSYAVINDYCSENPVSNVRVLTSHNDEPKRLPFSIPQLKQIIHSNLFTECVDDKHIEYKYIILLAIFTGARLEEICRLKNADIGVEDGISFIYIHPDLTSGHTLKTASSRRRVPLHPRLIEHFQFQKYLESVSNRKYVFPMINSGYTVVNRKSHSVSKWYGQFFTAIGLSDKRLTFHSFRHTFKALGRASGIERSILDCLQGHKDKSVSMSYGRDEYGSVYSLKTLYDAILKIDVFNVL